MIYFGTSGGKFLAIDWKNSKTVWSFQDKARQQAISGSAALTDKIVLVPGEDRTLRAFDSATGKQIWKKMFKGKLESSPVVVGERVFVGGHDGRLHAVTLDKGDEVWSYETGGKLLASPAVAAERLVIAGDDGHVYCFGAK
ncbi:MAG: PQQ-binding-like beta-propeller repeat protein [Pirellulales bacterium]